MMLAANMFVGPEIDWFKISPLLVMLGGVLLLILAGSLTPQWKKGAYGIVGALTAAGAAVSTALLWRDLGNGAQSSLLANAVTFSKFTLFATFSIAIATLLAILVTSGFLVREDEDSPEIFALILSAAIGGMVMVQANDLIVMFLGLETLSLAFYLLTASSRSRSASGEAGLKYFVLGGFASAFFLYGVALVFGATGSTNIDAIAASLSKDIVLGGSSAMLLAGIIGNVARRYRVTPCWFWIQGLACSVPHLDCRRVPRCANTNYRANGFGRKDGCICGSPSCVFGCSFESVR